MSKARTTATKQERAATYCRCSSDEQAQGDYTTVDVQRQITARHGVSIGAVVVAELSDEGKSGTSLKRPGLTALLALAQSGAIDVVIVTYMSRLGRGKAFTIAEYELKKCGVRVVCAEEQFSEGVAGYTQQAVKQFLDGMYPEQVKEWTMTKMRQMFEAGYHVNSRPPFGYQLIVAGEPGRNGRTPKRKGVDPDAAVIVEKAYRIALTQREIRAAVDYLNSATGQEWDYKTVYRLLTNRAYIGEAHWAGLVKPDAHPAIVPTDVFDAVQQMIEDAGQNRQKIVTRADRDSLHAASYYLRGRVFCATCGAVMTPKHATGKGGRIVHYYECLRASRSGSECPVRRVVAHRLHNSLFNEIGLMAAHPWRIRRHIEAAMERYPRPEKVDAELAAVQRGIRDAEKKSAKLIEAVAVSGTSVIGALSRRIAELEESRIAMTKEESRLLAEAARIRAWRPNAEQFERTLSLFSQIWERRTDAERCELAPLLVDRVTMETRDRAEAVLLPGLIDGTNLRSLRGKVREPDPTRDGKTFLLERVPFSADAKLPIIFAISRGSTSTRTRETEGTPV